GAASMIVNTTPVFTALLAAIFLGERLRAIGWAGSFVSLGGAALIGVAETLSHDGRFHVSPEAWVLFISALSWALNMVLQKPLLRRYTPVEITTYTLLLGTIPLLLYAPGFAANIHGAPLPATLLLVYLGTVPIAVAYSTWAWVLSRMDASRAASFL